MKRKLNLMKTLWNTSNWKEEHKMGTDLKQKTFSTLSISQKWPCRIKVDQVLLESNSGQRNLMIPSGLVRMST
jgi:hypothetical protein